MVDSLVLFLCELCNAEVCAAGVYEWFGLLVGFVTYVRLLCDS